MERQTMNHHRGDGCHSDGRIARHVPCAILRAAIQHPGCPASLAAPQACSRLSITRLLYTLVAVFGASVLLVACSKTIKWTEDVQLSNGQVIVIERETRFKPGGGEIATSSGWKPEVSFIRFRYPPGSREVVEWRTTKLSESFYPEHPLVFDMEGAGKKPYIIALYTIDGARDRFVKYVLTDGAWTEVQLPETFAPRLPNLLVGSRATNVERYVTLERKREESSKDFSRYHKRLRQVGPDRDYTGY